MRVFCIYYLLAISALALFTSCQNDDLRQVATIWVDGVPQPLISGDEGLDWSEVFELNSYGNDLYALSLELVRHTTDDDYDAFFLIWMNDTIIARYKNIDAVNFTVI